MIRAILKVVAGGLVALAVVVAVLYQFFGLRFVMDGGGTPYPRFVQTNEGQAERIERHREAQRAAAAAASRGDVAEPPPVAVEPVVAPGAPEPAAAAKTNAATPREPAPVLD